MKHTEKWYEMMETELEKIAENMRELHPDANDLEEMKAEIMLGIDALADAKFEAPVRKVKLYGERKHWGKIEGATEYPPEEDEIILRAKEGELLLEVIGNLKNPKRTETAGQIYYGEGPQGFGLCVKLYYRGKEIPLCLPADEADCLIEPENMTCRDTLLRECLEKKILEGREMITRAQYTGPKPEETERHTYREYEEMIEQLKKSFIFPEVD